MKKVLNVELLPKSTKGILLNPFAKSLDEAIGGVVGAVLKPFVKLSILNAANIEAYREKIKARYELIPEENRSSERIGLVLKAIEDSKYQLENNLLQDFFASLLAQTVDNRSNADI
ncbi:DUF4393 domain-containing protein [Listeria booriae]|uniref:DUF4393 domain-containing protein n=1 Tax=Listeria booriae TaxID=1552123 RepID=A0A099WDA9_9LIST|nr:hypothetical protein EP57_04240 [Listeria booriae]MBC1906100.1 DUF4393 domain-containing protein [Listeria booriae]STY40910.1 Uncharacterised protein [Listeria booriae]